MAMNWIKGLVAPAAQFAGQQGFPPGMQQPGAPPIGGAPPYGYPQQPMPMQQPVPMQPPEQWQPQQWSQGTRTQGDAGGPIAQQPIAQQPLAGADRVAQLQHDVESLALFARTLLTMLEEKNIVTRQQFDETKRRLDMLDGKLDDR